jgi:hypothetical protein
MNWLSKKTENCQQCPALTRKFLQQDEASPEDSDPDWQKGGDSYVSI